MTGKTFIGVDIGGTNMRIALVDDTGTILDLRKLPTHSDQGARETSRRLVDACRSLMSETDPGGRPVAAIGLGVAGKIDRLRGEVVFSPNLPDMDHYPLARELEQQVGVPVVMENDANVFGLGELWSGKGKGISNWVGLTLGTGVGGCLILNGRLWNGDDLGFAAEIGHMIVDPGGPRCHCGLRGCLEAHSSGTALVQGVVDAISAGGLSSGALYDHWQAGSLDARAVYDAATAGDAPALRLFERMGWALGLALANLFTVLGIRHAIIGGGVSSSWELFEPAMLKSLGEHSSMLGVEAMVVQRSALLDNAAPVGAAHLAAELVL